MKANLKKLLAMLMKPAESEINRTMALDCCEELAAWIEDGSQDPGFWIGMDACERIQAAGCEDDVLKVARAILQTALPGLVMFLAAYERMDADLDTQVAAMQAEAKGG